jgi:hypothetical protein
MLGLAIGVGLVDGQLELVVCLKLNNLRHREQTCWVEFLYRVVIPGNITLNLSSLVYQDGTLARLEQLACYTGRITSDNPLLGSGADIVFD